MEIFLGLFCRPFRSLPYATRPPADWLRGFGYVRGTRQDHAHITSQYRRSCRRHTWTPTEFRQLDSNAMSTSSSPMGDIAAAVQWRQESVNRYIREPRRRLAAAPAGCARAFPPATTGGETSIGARPAAPIGRTCAPVEKCVPIGALGLRLNTPQPPPERTHALPRRRSH